MYRVIQRLQHHSLCAKRTLASFRASCRPATMSTSIDHADNPATFPVQASITDKLKRALDPSHLDVINESHMHNVPKNSETHFKVVVVSSQFEKIKSPLQRHRLIHGALEDELYHPVHALSIVAKSPSQWEAMVSAGKSIPLSPSCRGGDGSLPPKGSV